MRTTLILYLLDIWAAGDIHKPLCIILAKKNPRKAEDYNGVSINIKMLTIDETAYFAYFFAVRMYFMGSTASPSRHTSK